MVQLPSFLRPGFTGPSPAPTADAPMVPTPMARLFAIDLFAPRSAAIQVATPAFPGPTLDDLQGGAARFLDVGAIAEPVGGSAPGRVLREGARGPEVERLQQQLAARGFDPGGADGDFGPATSRALRAFQRSQGLQADGAYGPASRARLTGRGGVPAPRPAAPAAAAGTIGVPGSTGAPPARTAEGGATRARLLGDVDNHFKGRSGKCFRYAWHMVTQAGLNDFGQAAQSHAGRHQDTAYVGDLVRQGKLRVGDVVYVNRRPGADPSSTDMRFGPHWFVYVGQGQFADQYGIRGAQAMSDFVPGRKIDAIYHTA